MLLQDVHHGNGIEEILYSRADAMYISLHRWGLCRRCHPPPMQLHLAGLKRALSGMAEAGCTPMLAIVGLALSGVSHGLLHQPLSSEGADKVLCGDGRELAQLTAARSTVSNVLLLFIWCSCRANGFYPGTGDIADFGKGPGRGFNLNIPFPRGGFNDADYVAAFDLVHRPLEQHRQLLASCLCNAT